MQNKQNIIIYDEICNMCSTSVKFIAKRDKDSKFTFLSQQSEEGKNIMKKYFSLDGNLDTIILIEDEKHFTKSDAVLEITKELTGLWFLFSCFKIVPKFIRDFLYDLIAKNRYKFFGKNNSCEI